MKKLILLTVLLFNVNAMAEEYNVVCHMGYYGIVIKSVEDIELAQEIVQKLSWSFSTCKTIKVKN